ncbi:MAG: D-alanine--D-alanine ligase [Kiritimatiellae bacterium]|nr:D-alanine--D-alanine ligase [Kiritimatiellia bacterium]
MTVSAPERVAVLMGGPSTERDISLMSGDYVLECLRSFGTAAHPCVVGKDCAFELPEGTEVAYIALHGIFGEDGQVQRLLEARGIPYTGDRADACARAFDKVASKRCLLAHGVPVPAAVFLSRPAAGEPLPPPPPAAAFPLVVKPARQGSSVGMSLVKDPSGWDKALETVFALDAEGLAETYIPGREFTVGIVAGEALPVLEICMERETFDFGAKYTAGAVTHRFGTLPPEEEARVKKIVLDAAAALDCRALGRVDLRRNDAGEFFVLELNNTPGFTKLSLLPDEARAAGRTPADLCREILLAAH